MKNADLLHSYAVFVAVCTLFLIFAGGLVTSTGSGLAVPDWPLSFGQVFPEMEGGVAYEHGHRMVAAFVGLLTLALAIWLWKSERRRWVRRLGTLAVVAVMLQGGLGGATVLLQLPLATSVAHAALAQIFLCLTTAIAVATSSEWKTPREFVEAAGHGAARTLALVAIGAIYLQILLGALMRHMAGGLAIPDFPLSFGRLAPPFLTAPVFFNYAHRIVGLIVIVSAILFVRAALKSSGVGKTLRHPALVLMGSLTIQIALGAIAIWSRKAPLPTTFHVAFGALTLAVCLWLAMNAFRFLPPVKLEGEMNRAAA